MMLTTSFRQLAVWLGVISLSPAVYAQTEYAINFQAPVTETAQQIYQLHMLIFWICVAIGAVVFSVMLISILLHRKSKGVKPAQFHESTTVEILWTLIPFVILIGMAIPATKTLIAMADTANSEMSIKITASQFKWQYDYLNEEVSLISALSTPQAQIFQAADKNEHYLLEVDNPLVLPTDTRIRFLLTAADVIHAWWVPALGLKKDAVPGFINEMWAKIDQPGIYRGQCAELCGANHGFMPIVLDVRSPEDYQSWVAERQAAKAAELAALAANKEWRLDELNQRGEKVFLANCAVCHQASGQGMLPAFPAINGSQMVLQQDASTQIEQVLNGKNAMPSFAASLNDLDIAAVITYTKNAWDNQTGMLVQPSAVAAAR